MTTPDPEATWVLPPEATDVTGLLGRALDGTATGQALEVITALAKAHTRGRGFDNTSSHGKVAPEIAAVIVAAAARLAANPQQLARTSVQADGASVEHVGSFAGWTLPEVLALNAWRRRTA